MRSHALVALVCVFIAGCLGDGEPLLEGYEGGSSTMSEEDTGADPGDASEAGGDEGDVDGQEDASVECTWPTEGTGFALGDTFSPDMVLRECDGTERTLGELMCGHKLTLIDLSAGWCQPCKEQALTLDLEIYEPYKDAGLQVVSIIFQSEDSGVATSSTCEEWRDAFELTSPVLTDPFFNLNGGVKAMFDAAGGAAPVNMLVDETFTIKYVHSGEKPVGLDKVIEGFLSD